MYTISYYGDIFPYRTGLSHATSGHITITMDMPYQRHNDKYIIKPLRQNITRCQGNISHSCPRHSCNIYLALTTCDILPYRLDNSHSNTRDTYASQRFNTGLVSSLTRLCGSHRFLPVLGPVDPSVELCAPWVNSLSQRVVAEKSVIHTMSCNIINIQSHF